MSQNSDNQDAQNRIIEAAHKRFMQYGYVKTNIAEIAADADMSAANIYRYFDNKLEIAGVCAGRCLDKEVELLREVARNPKLPPREKLLKFVLVMLEYTYDFATNNDMANEVVEIITNKRPELVHNMIRQKHSLVAEILAQGNERGDFDVEDVVGAAEAFLSAMVKFDVPLFMSLYSYEQLEQRARGVVALMIRGLEARH